MEAQAPARVAPNTRPRSLVGTTSEATVKRSGLSGPAARPTTASATSAARNGGSVASARYMRGTTEKQQTNDEPSRHPMAESAVRERPDERSSAEDAVHEAELGRAAVCLAGEHRGMTTGSGASRRLVSRTVSTIARMSR